MRAGFLGESEQPGLGEVSATVAVGTQPVSVSTNGLVTRKPGLYALTILVDAVQPEMASPQRLAPEVHVTVR